MIADLLRLRDRPRRIVGLNSGTSADGVDVALVEIDGAGETTRARVLRFAKVPHPAALAARLRAPLAAGEIATLSFELARAFAAATRAVVGGEPFDLVASHGQTIAHHGRAGTLQIGEPAVLAEILGRPVVSGFRARDVAAGGEGAPLVPLADYLLFRRPGATLACQNLGGIANVTIVGDSLAATFAFDTGPGNMPLDEVARRLGEPYDRGGARAAAGAVDEATVAELLRHPYFSRPPPRTTGREDFGAAFVEPLWARFGGRADDLLATLTRFVAVSIRDAYRRFCPRVDEVLVSGGGVDNATLRRHLVALFAPVPVRSTAELGIDPGAKEALAFAVLANQTIHDLPGNVPAATGATGPRVLGAISPT
ncbi:MAG TPA: anhydro-N-acetylmuramic acid kinase [Haliangiales bacterium]|nr:anhydro-N-acetylmuramic acid kinase [Haliangiales bacterium]